MADTPQTIDMTHQDAAFASYLKQMLHEARAESSNSLSHGDIEALARDLYTWSTKVEETATRVRPAKGEQGRELEGCILESVGPDRPFLVDSLLSTCTDQGFEVRALFHPIVDTDKGPRSLIQIHLPDLTSAEQDSLAREATATLEDVAVATADYQSMRTRMLEEADKLEACKHVSERYKSEAIAFLKWLGEERFVFLGVRDYLFKTGATGQVLPEEPDIVEGTSLGLLRDEKRNVLNRGAEPLILSEEIGAFLEEPESLILAKATLVSRVHRRVACDYVGVKHYGKAGEVIGETRFVGLYTSEAYNESIRDIPLLRKRAERVIELNGAVQGSHNEKALSHIMERWPRDELIQTKSEHLAPIMMGVLNLIGRPRVCLFVRPDRFNRFVSVFVFVPREAYDTALRQRMSEALEKAWNGRLTNFEPSFDGSSLVRVLFEIALPHQGPQPDLKTLENKLEILARSWNDRFRTAIMARDLNKEERSRAGLFHGAFTAAYREAFSPEEAMTDVAMLADINAAHPIRLRAFRLNEDAPDVVRAKIYARDGAIPLSECVPVFERMGLFVNFEIGYPVTPHEKPVADAPDTYWVHSLSMCRANAEAIDLEQIGEAFEDAFAAVWQEQAENDGFNALVLTAGLSWREAALCRALCAYRYQTGLDPARQTQIAALNAYPDLTRHLVSLFKLRFDPASTEDRTKACDALQEKIELMLRDVVSLDHDRVLRRLAHLIMAIQRTNFFQTQIDGTPRAFISFKIASRDLEDLPDPKPYREIFVSSPQVEGVHCRFGPVARGGLRWSDRRDDFRTEVLGLVKAQQVKNAVIVPVGSKGGFFPKNLPEAGSREAIREAGIEAYKTFITGLLDLTDNLIDGVVEHPVHTVIHDGEDPYLVVAADKGTATFSDIANEISQANGFWLGDAFASGGSAGYDHKKMGITARGAWEAVKRHFREIGTDIQTEPFTVIGCGDMSGDVFGNGMLLSKQTRLQAAFNHMHVFIDPDPIDPEQLWNERKRLFDLPRSSWTDYNASLISEGGGVFKRSAKAIELTPQIKALTGLGQDSVTPDELIHALLKAPCDLLWFGGIGTYIKASHESHAEAGDRTNDSLRVDGKEVRAKVIGEGANLGLTQAGRIEAAQNKVRLNTDAIDNSAGVDSSDHEVNIKILCTEAMRRGDLPRGERNTLLASMTDDVGEYVLRHNYAQTGALSLAEQSAGTDHDANERLMVRLEQRGVLDRIVEELPSTAQMQARAEAGLSLTRPELSVLMAWTKIVLFDDLVASSVPDDPFFETTLTAYFPDALKGYQNAMHAHRLKREIIATVLANRIIDVCGPVFLLRLIEQTGVETPEIVAAFETARKLLEAESLQAKIDALDNQADANRQMELQRTLADALFIFTRRLLIDNAPDTEIETRLEALQPHLQAITEQVPGSLSRYETAQFNKKVQLLAKDGVPEKIAAEIAQTIYLARTPLIAPIAESQNLSSNEVFPAFLVLGDALLLDRLRTSAELALKAMPYWDRLATRRLLNELEQRQADATQYALQEEGLNAWLTRNETARQELVQTVRTYTSSQPSFAQLALAADALRKFTTAAL